MVNLKFCYEIFCGERKAKNIFEKIIYKIWLSCGVSPSKLMSYCLNKEILEMRNIMEEKLKKKIILYHTNPLEFGGVDTFDYNFCKKLKDKYDITFVYKYGNEKTIKRLESLGIKVNKYDDNKRYECDICILASAWGGYPETVIAKSGRYIQMVHADYKRAVEVDFHYTKWHKTTEHVGVSDQVCKSFKEMYPKEKITRIYNILDDKLETKPILKLVSATRLSKEKGYSRMLKLAKSLKEAGIRFRWTIFTDLELYNQKPIDMDEIVYMNPTRDIFDYIAEADYGVQLSDTEGYSYFINECLQYGTPVICTNFPSAYEIMEDEVNGYILDMDLSNLNIDKIVNNIPNKFKYTEKGKVNDWTKLLNKKSIQKKSKKIKVYKITPLEDYEDKKPEYILTPENLSNNKAKRGISYYIKDESRAKIIKESGLATVKEVDV